MNALCEARQRASILVDEVSNSCASFEHIRRKCGFQCRDIVEEKEERGWWKWSRAGTTLAYIDLTDVTVPLQPIRAQRARKKDVRAQEDLCFLCLSGQWEEVRADMDRAEILPQEDLTNSAASASRFVFDFQVPSTSVALALSLPYHHHLSSSYPPGRSECVSSPSPPP